MRVEIICIGTELLGGKVNSNSTYLGDRLGLIGLEPSAISTVGDRRHELEEAFRTALARSQIIIATGGLGPTFDDLTREAVAKAVDRRLVLDRDTLSSIARFFAKRGKEMPKNNEAQAYMIEGARVLANAIGTAPGQILEIEPSPGRSRAVIILLPGPPREMQLMFEESVFPYLKRYETGIRRAFTLHVFGLSESAVDEKIRPIIEAEKELESGTVDFTILAHQMVIDIKARVSGGDELIIDEILTNLRHQFYELLGDDIYGEDRQSLESVVGELLARSRMTLSIAESCTGGLVAHRITNIPGSSLYFKEGAVTYSNEAKTKMLGISPQSIERFGAVSEQVALEMAEGIRNISGTDYAISITGIAGPSGGSDEKPVGLIFIGVASPRRTQVLRFHFSGNRNDVRERAANQSLDLLRRELLSAKKEEKGKRR